MATAVKICGITRLEDALAAAALGANALGFVLWPDSPRAVTLETVARIAAATPPLLVRVGVFVDPDAEAVGRARAAGIQVVQVHGRAPVVPAGMPLLQAASLAPEGETIAPDVTADTVVLLDAHDPRRRGGTGRTIDWQRARAVAARRPVILAGGLTPDNVGLAIQTVRPAGVDVSSGVESAPGVKDPDKLAAFVAAVRAHA